MSVPDPAGIRRVADPLAPAEVDRRKQALWKIVRGIPKKPQQAITTGMLVLGLSVGILLGVVLESAFVGLLGPLVLALVLAFGQVWAQMYREARAARELRALQDRWTIAVPDAETGELVSRIASDIAALPASMRADFAPLVDTVRECCTALAQAPGTDRYLAMLRERAQLVGQVRQEYDALVAAQRESTAMERFAGDTTGQDLVIATQIRDALATVRAELGDAAGPRPDDDATG